MKIKNLMAMAAATTLVLTAFSGCGSSTEDISAANGNISASSGSTAENADTSGAAEASAADANGDEDLEDIATINIMFWTMNTVPNDVQMVEDAINEITREKINAEIDLTIVDMGNYAQQINLIVTSNEKLDLMITLPGESAHFNAMTSQNQLMPITDLLQEYAPDLLATVPESWMKGTEVNGEIYAVTSYADKATPFCFACRTDILEQTGIDPSTLKTADDFTELFAKVKEVDSQINPLWGAITTPYMIDPEGNFVAYDGLGESGTTGIISIFPGNGSTITDLYETDIYESTVQQMNEWYEAGYVDKDAATKDPTQESDVKAGTTFGYFKLVSGGSASASMVEQSTGRDMTVIELADAIINTGSIRKFTWAVPQSATEPEAAVKFLNLLYTDADIVNLLTWGIEGVHYQTLDDGTIDFMPGEDATSCGYYIGDFSSIIGNGFLAKVRAGQPADYREQTLKLNQNAILSDYLGFGIDTSAATNTLTALTNVVSEFNPSLLAGVSGPDQIPAFIEKLKAADVDNYVATMQQQLDAWIEENQTSQN